VFENRMLRRIFGQRRDEVTGVWRGLYRVITKEMTEIKHVLLSHGVT
jgi:hypothetical protein